MRISGSVERSKIITLCFLDSYMNDPKPENVQKSPGSHPAGRPDAPTDPDGPPNGGDTPSEPATGGPLPSSSDAPHGQPDAPPAVVQALHLAGEPDTLPPTWVRKCAATVKPEGRGQCPRCGRMLRANFSARKHPVNRLRRQQLLDKFVTDYQPNTQRLQSMCEQYPASSSNSEVLKPGSPDHQRLVQLSQLPRGARRLAVGARHASE